MNENKEENNNEDIIIIKCGDGEIHLGPPCPPLPKEFRFDFKKEEEKEQNDTSTT
jgi:hypothetical protein